MINDMLLGGIMAALIVSDIANNFAARHVPENFHSVVMMFFSLAEPLQFKGWRKPWEYL